MIPLERRVRLHARRLMRTRAMARLANDRLERDGYVVVDELWRDAMLVARVSLALDRKDGLR